MRMTALHLALRRGDWLVALVVLVVVLVVPVLVLLPPRRRPHLHLQQLHQRQRLQQAAVALAMLQLQHLVALQLAVQHQRLHLVHPPRHLRPLQPAAPRAAAVLLAAAAWVPTACLVLQQAPVVLPALLHVMRCLLVISRKLSTVRPAATVQNDRRQRQQMQQLPHHYTVAAVAALVVSARTLMRLATRA